MPANFSFQPLVCSGLIAMGTIIGGCAYSNGPVQPAVVDATEQVPKPVPTDFVPVVRYGRYTLVELTPEAAQRDLLLQVVAVRVPEDARASVGDGLRHVLKRSGYRLCDTSPVANELFSLPLPTAHHQLGPMTLREGLLTLAGAGWQLEVDERSRRVCFVAADAAPLQRREAGHSDMGLSMPLTSGEPS